MQRWRVRDPRELRSLGAQWREDAQDGGQTYPYVVNGGIEAKTPNTAPGS